MSVINGNAGDKSPKTLYKSDVHPSSSITPTNNIAVKTPIKPKKTVIEKIQEDLRGTYDSSVKYSWTRAILSRSLSSGLMTLIPGIGVNDYLKYVKNVAFPLQVSYQIVDRAAQAMGGTLLPQFSAMYETKNGSYRDQVGTSGHIAAKTTDTIANGIARSIVASVIVSMIKTSYKGSNNFSQNYLKDWLHGGAFGTGNFDGGGGLAMRLNYRSTLDAGANLMRGMGLHNTWLGILGAAAIGSAGFTDMQVALNGLKSTKGNWLKAVGKAASDRIGTMANAYGYFLPGVDISKEQRLEKIEKDAQDARMQPIEERIRDEKIKSVHSIASMIYAGTSIGAGIAIPYLISQNMKSK